MRAWVSAFGNPLVCLISETDGLAAYRFGEARATAVRMPCVEQFPRGVIVAFDGDEFEP